MANVGFFTNRGIDGVGADNFCSTADLHVFQGRVRANRHVITQDRRAQQLRARQDRHVLANLNLNVDAGGGGIHHGGTGTHGGFHRPPIQFGAGFRQLNAIVYAS